MKGYTPRIHITILFDEHCLLGLKLYNFCYIENNGKFTRDKKFRLVTSDKERRAIKNTRNRARGLAIKI